MNVDKHTQLRDMLFRELGKEKVEKAKEDIIKAIKTCNLDCTYGTLDEFFKYVKECIHIAKI